jgi:hypothetical protein
MNKAHAFLGVVSLMVFAAPVALGGNLEPSEGPAPTMVTLQEIYDGPTIQAQATVRTASTIEIHRQRRRNGNRQPHRPDLVAGGGLLRHRHVAQRSQ